MLMSCWLPDRKCGICMERAYEHVKVKCLAQSCTALYHKEVIGLRPSPFIREQI